MYQTHSTQVLRGTRSDYLALTSDVLTDCLFAFERSLPPRNLAKQPLARRLTVQELWSPIDQDAMEEEEEEDFFGGGVLFTI